MTREKLPSATKKLISQLAAGYGLLLVVLATAHVCLAFYPNDYWLANLVDLDSEGNLPSWYASILWFSVAICALAAFFVETAVHLEARGRFVWLLIAGAFAIASVDEATALHERAGLMFAEHLRQLTRAEIITDRLPDSPWLILYALPILLILGSTVVFIRLRTMHSSNAILTFVVAAVGAYAIALNCELYQGLPMHTCTAIANAMKMNVDWLIATSVLIEEVAENIGSLLLILGFTAYAHSLAWAHAQRGEYPAQ